MSLLFYRRSNMQRRSHKPLEGLHQQNFNQLSRSKGTSKERRRYLAFAHIQDGKSFTEAAAMVKVSLKALMNWVDSYRKNGIEGLKDRPGRGSKPLLPNKDLDAFREAVLELQASRSGGRIKGKDVLKLMTDKFGILPSRSTIYDTLKRADLVWITGRSQHPKANVADQDAFKKTLLKTSVK
jgi:transposase